MKPSFTELIDLFSRRWHQPMTAVVTALVLLVGLLYYFANVSFASITSVGAIVSLAAPLIFLFVWWLLRRAPRCPRDTIGIILAIHPENDLQAVQLRNDFITHLRRCIAQGHAAADFRIVTYPDWLSSQITTPEAAVRYLDKSRAHFMYRGLTRIRNIDGKQQHLLQLEGLVRTTPLQVQPRIEFAKEFREVLPQYIGFAQENDVFSFQVTAAWLGIVARHIIGTAAAMSGDMSLACSLFEELMQEIAASTVRPMPPPIRALQQRLPGRLVSVYGALLWQAYRKWLRDHERVDLDRAEGFANKMLSLDPKCYPALLQRAIYKFLAHRDVNGAMIDVRKCRGQPNTTWRYSEAFLQAYEGNLAGARRSLELAQRGIAASDAALQSEQFINLILEEEPQQAHLHYCLGWINYYAKTDFASAIREFEWFLQRTDATRFGNERASASRLVAEARARLGLSPSTES